MQDWLWLALMSAFFIAASDALVKRYLSTLDVWELIAVRLVWSGILLLPLWLALPESMRAVDPRVWPWMAIAVPLEFLAMVAYVRALQLSPLATSIPYLAFTPVFVVLIAWVWLGETVSLIGILGIALVVMGAIFLNGGALAHAEHSLPRSWPRLLQPVLPLFMGLARSHGARLILWVALIYSITAVAGKGALPYVTSALGFGLFYLLVLAAAGGLGLLLLRPRALWVGRELFWPALVAALCMSAMVVTHFLALTHTETALMMAVKRLSPLFSILFGFWWFAETGLKRNLVAATAMVAGAALVMAGGQ